MEARLHHETSSAILGRKEVVLDVAYEGTTPSKLLLRRKVAELAKCSEENVMVQNITTRAGSREARVVAQVYKDAQTMKDLESPYRFKRMEKLSGKKTEEAPQSN